MKDFENSGIDLQDLESLLNRAEKKKSLEELAAPYLVHWKWILFSVVLASIAAFIYLRYAEKVYQVNSSIILKDQKDNRIRGGNAIFSSMDLMGTVNNVDNEIEVMRSKSIIRGAVNTLNLHTTYAVKGRVKTSNLYTASPLLVTMDQSSLDKLRVPVSFQAVIKKDQSVTIKRMENGKELIHHLAKLPALLRTKQGVLTWSFRAGNVPSYGNPMDITISPPASVVNGWRSKLTITPTSKTTSVMNMRLITAEPAKGVDFLNTLVEVYNQDAIADKNREALNTKDFIDERIAIIDQELGAAEKNAE